MSPVLLGSESCLDRSSAAQHKWVGPSWTGPGPLPDPTNFFPVASQGRRHATPAPAARNTRPPGPPVPIRAAPSWLRHCVAGPRAHGGDLCVGRRGALPGAAPPVPRRASSMPSGPRSENNRRARYLHVDRGRTEAAARRHGGTGAATCGRSTRSCRARKTMRKPRPFWYLRRAAITSEVDEELHLHLDMRVAELIAEGHVHRTNARRMRPRQFGDLETTRRYCRQQDEKAGQRDATCRMLQDVLQDLRIGAPQSAARPGPHPDDRRPVGLGLGATAAIFSAVSAAMLRPLPYATRIGSCGSTPIHRRSSSGSPRSTTSAFTEQQTRFERSATYTDRSVSFIAGDTAELLRTRVVSWGFFSRTWHPTDASAAPSPSRTAARAPAGRDREPRVLAAAARRPRGRDWEAASARRRRVHGHRACCRRRTVRSNGVSTLFLIQQFTPPTRKGPFLYSVIARLPRGADRAPATSELHAINRALFPIWKSSYQDDASTWNMEDLKTSLARRCRHAWPGSRSRPSGSCG